MNEQLQDPGLSRLWREHATETPSPALDQAILAAARREVGTRPQAVGGTKSGLASWRVPLAAAASVVLAVTVVLLAPENTVTPDERMPAEVRVEPPRQPAAQADSVAAPSVMKQEAPPPATAAAAAPAEAVMPKPEVAVPAAKTAPASQAPISAAGRQRRNEPTSAGPAAAADPTPAPIGRSAAVPTREQLVDEPAPNIDKLERVEVRRQELAPRGGEVAPRRDAGPAPRPFPASPPAPVAEPPLSRKADAPVPAQATPPPPSPPLLEALPAPSVLSPPGLPLPPPPQTASSPGAMAAPSEPASRPKAKSQTSAVGSVDSSPRPVEEAAKPAPAAPAKLRQPPQPEVSSQSKVEVSGSNIKRGNAEPPTRTPADWIELLRRLRRDARWDDFRRELAEFQRTYPDYRIPEDLR